jgi:hypothetical protein
MNLPDSPTSTVLLSTARRKLIRAGFAVPVIATVASGSAMAAQSTMCFNRQLSSPNYPAVTPLNNASLDNYMRVQLGKRTNGNGNGNPVYFVDGDNLDALFIAIPRANEQALIKSASYTLGAGEYQEFNIQNGAGGNSEVGDVIQAKPVEGWTYTRQSGRFAVLRFDSRGEVVGVGFSNAPQQSAVQLSCWSSLAPAP